MGFYSSIIFFEEITKIIFLPCCAANVESALSSGCFAPIAAQQLSLNNNSQALKCSKLK